MFIEVPPMRRFTGQTLNHDQLPHSAPMALALGMRASLYTPAPPPTASTHTRRMPSTIRKRRGQGPCSKPGAIPGGHQAGAPRGAQLGAPPEGGQLQLSTRTYLWQKRHQGAWRFGRGCPGANHRRRFNSASPWPIAHAATALGRTSSVLIGSVYMH